MKFSCIKAKLIILLFAISILPLLITTTVIFFLTDKGYTNLTNDHQEKMMHHVQSELDNVSKDLLKITNPYSQNEQLISNFQSINRD